MNWLNMRITSEWRTSTAAFVLAALLSSQVCGQDTGAAGSTGDASAEQPAAVSDAAPGADAATVSSGYEEALKQYGAEPVEATQVNGPNRFEPVTMLDLDVGGLKLKYPNLDSPITLPEERLTFRVIYRPDIDIETYNRLRAEGRTGEALELIREVTYPLLKFVPLDPATVAIHGQVDRMLRLLLAEGELEEAAAIIETFSRERLSETFAGTSMEIAARLAEQGDVERAYDLVKRFPLGPGQTTYVDFYLDLANDLREREEWEKARALYKDVQLASGPTQFPEAFLWEAYIYLQEDRAFMVGGVVDQVGEMDEESPYFSLLELIRGVSLAQEGNRKEALSAFAKGVVYATTNDPWTPELLYRTAELYEEEGKKVAAGEIRDQLRFFYPDSIWTERVGSASS